MTSRPTIHPAIYPRPARDRVADTQYWNEQHMDEVIANKHVQVLIPPDSGTREKPRPGWTGARYTWMRYVPASGLGERLYRNANK